MYAMIAGLAEERREAILFMAAPGRLRVVAKGSADTMDLFSIDGQTWFTDAGHPVRFDFLAATNEYGPLVKKSATAAA
jgi:hypothetical protein